MSKARHYIKDRPDFLNIQHGAVRTGKTTNTAILTPLRIIEQIPKAGDVIITGRTSDTAYRNVVRLLQGMFGERVTFNRGEYEGTIAGRRFFVLGANDERAAEKIQGMTVAWWLGDEVSLYPESFVQMGINRLSLEGSCADWTMNPQGPYHYIKTQYIDRAAEVGAKVYHYELKDNERNLAPGYVDRLIAAYGGLDTLWGKRFIRGLWVVAEGSIYDFWDGEIHTLQQSPPPDYWAMAADYGTSNASAVGLFGVRERGLPICWMEDEWYYSGLETGRQKTDAQQANEIIYWLEQRGMCKAERRQDSEGLEFIFAANLKPQFVYVDPSSASFQAELRRRGFKVLDANNDVVNGIRTQAAMLQTGRYKVHARCERTIKDYSGYVWDKRAQERGEDKPLKGSGASPDQTKDCERYFLHSQFGDGLFIWGAA